MINLAENVVRRVLATEDPDDDVGELEIAEYVVFLLALDTYTRYVEEQAGADAEDDLIRKGLQLVRLADRRHLAVIHSFLSGAVPTAGQKKMLDKAFRFLPSNSASLGRRTWNLRTVMSRGGASTMRAVFKTNKALQEVKAAMAAANTDDADEALDKFAVIPMKNQRLRKWIDDAAETAGSGTFQNAVAAGTSGTADDAEQILAARAQQQGASPTSDDNKDELDRKDDLLLKVQQDAQASAQRAMAVTGEPDEPPAKSEVVGIATAAAVAAITDPSNPSNVPVPLRKLDDEQRAAALTDGRVLVAAGAGAGKSTTVVSRVEYLVKDRRVLPSRVMVTSFNAKAANELKQKIGTACGGDVLNQMSVGTMHSLFRRFIGEYGTAPERSAMGVSKDRGGFVQGGGTVARAVQRIWTECYPEGSPQERKVPKLKNVLMAKSKWAGNNVTPAEAKAQATKSSEVEAADWYEMYEGLKGSIPGWKPPCTGSKGHESFMAKWRPNDQRLGDFDDMLGIFDNILKREPLVKKTLQGMYDHIIVDEAQDLSGVQFSIISQMSEHVTDGKDGKSLWICGDDKQSIYTFRGARPDLFTSLNTTPGWTTKMIRTNYRCQPEIVDCANKLIAHNENQIPMEASPSSAKARGVGSVRVNTTTDEADAALDVVEEIKANVMAGGDVANNAILTRTNKEQHAFETACIIRGVPYARKGASSFLGSPETKTFLSYVQLVTGDDFAKMQVALGEVINKPNRFFVGPDAGVSAVQEALSKYARATGQDIKSISPMAALANADFIDFLAEKLARTNSGFKFDKTVEKLDDLKSNLEVMRADSADPKYTTKDLFDGILGLGGTVAVTTPSGRTVYVEQTFRDSLKADLRDSVDEDDSEAEDEDSEGLGNVSFLYELAKKDPTDPEDLITDPNTPFGFKAKMERYAARARDLRIDLTKWDKEQAALPPAQRKAPPGVYLGTVHCSPADEPVLTTGGWVPIGDLDPDRHRLTSYASSCNQLFWGDNKTGHAGPDGYGFVKSVMPYKGPLLTLTTLQSKTRVTPDHRIRVKWAERFYNRYVVYLMRRGDWWRVGAAKSGNRPYGGSDFKQRVSAEKADACWILSVHETRPEAILEEARIQGCYGITGLTFEASNQRRVSSEQLYKVHDSISAVSQERVERLLADYGLDKRNPLYVGQGRDADMRSAFTIQARNCLNGYMLLPVVSRAFVERSGPRDVWTKPEWHEVSLTRELFEGDVYSLSVPPHHFYVSGGAIVHNSVKGAQWKNCYVSMPKGKFPFQPPQKPGEPPPPEEAVKEEMESERRLAYVALTRAAMNLTIVCPASVGGKPAGVSPFVDEAGLKVGENVPKPGAPEVPPEPSQPIKIATAYEGLVPDEWAAPSLTYDRRPS